MLSFQPYESFGNEKILNPRTNHILINLYNHFLEFLNHINNTTGCLINCIRHCFKIPLTPFDIIVGWALLNELRHLANDIRTGALSILIRQIDNLSSILGKQKFLSTDVRGKDIERNLDDLIIFYHEKKRDSIPNESWVSTLVTLFKSMGPPLRSGLVRRYAASVKACRRPCLAATGAPRPPDKQDVT